MTSKTMAEVLAEHGEWRYTNGAGSAIVCRKCGAPVENVVEHQAAALSAAGFGLVADAKAEAWDEAYKLGVDDERTNPGIAGCFCHGSPCHCFIAPARVNPYRATP